MAISPSPGDDHIMFLDAFIPRGQLPATASRLERAASELRERAGSPTAVPRLPATLAHLEGTLDELAASIRLMAEAAAAWSDADAAIADEATLPPDARALLWHLRAVADTLGEARDRCPATRTWARQMLDVAASDTNAATETDRGVIVDMLNMQPPSDAPRREHTTRPRIVCGVDGTPEARHAASTALWLADRLGARLTLVHVTPTRTMVPVDSLPLGVDLSAYSRSTELSFSESEDAFDTLPPEVLAASPERELRLGEPAVVLAEVAADCDADMIVVGSRGHGAWRSAVLGSVSSDLARRAPCPVVIVPERAAVESRAA